MSNENPTNPNQKNDWDYDKINELLDLDPEVDSESPLETPDTFDDEQEEQEKPKKNGLAKSPWAKLALVAGLGGLGLWFISLIFSFAPSSNTNIVQEESEEIETQTVDTEETVRPQLAVARQQSELERLSRLLDEEEETPTLVIDEPEPVVIEPIPEPTPPPAPPPEPMIFNDPPPIVYNDPTPPPPPPEPPPQNTMDDWYALANMGSYGTGVVQRPSSEPRNVINNNEQPATQTVVDEDIIIQQRPQSLTREEQRLMGNIPPVIRAGTTIKASIVNSLIAVDGEAPYLAVVTSEPIEVDGKVVIPTGTEIIFESSVHSTGMVIASATSMFMNNQEFTLPEQVLQLRRSGGEPLMATRQNKNGGQILLRDAGSFVLGALGKVGEISNRPRTTSTFNGINGTSTTSTFEEPNYTGAVLEGGFNPLARQWERRNQEAISALQSQGVIWTIPIGQPVEIVIGRSFSM